MFLNGVIKEQVYIKQPEGFETHERRIHVCTLKKALYGLKQRHTGHGRVGLTVTCNSWESSRVMQIPGGEWASHSGFRCRWSTFDRIVEAHKGLQKEPCNRIRHEGYGVDALFFGVGSLVEEWGNLPRTREICYKNSEEIQNAGLQTHGDAHGYQLEKDRCFKGQGHRPHLVQINNWVTHVFGQHQTRDLFRCQYP